MAYKNSDNQFVDVARLAFWSKQSKSGTNFLSGFVEFADGTKVNCRIFKATEKRSDNSPDFYGMGSVPEDEVGLEIVAEEYETKKPAAKKAPAKRTKKSDEIEF